MYDTGGLPLDGGKAEQMAEQRGPFTELLETADDNVAGE